MLFAHGRLRHAGTVVARVSTLPEYPPAHLVAQGSLNCLKNFEISRLASMSVVEAPNGQKLWRIRSVPHVPDGGRVTA